MIGASQSALSIQKPSQSGPRTHPVDHFLTHAAAVPISSTAAGEESSVIRALLSASSVVHSVYLSGDFVITAVANPRHRQSPCQRRLLASTKRGLSPRPVM